MNPTEDLWVLTVARIYFGMVKVELAGMVDMVDNMDMLDSVNMETV